MSPDEKLIYMANQIATFFAAQGERRAAEGVADHIQKFWDPEMRRKFLALAAQDAGTLHPAVKAALPILRSAAAPAS